MKKIILGVILGAVLGLGGQKLIAYCTSCYSCKGTGLRWDQCIMCGGRGGEYKQCYSCSGRGQNCY